MFTTTMLSVLSWVLPAAPPTTTFDCSVAASTPTLTQSEPKIRGSSSGEVERADGRRARWVSVTYELSSGQEAQAFVEVDTRGVGEAMIDVEGEPLLHVIVDEQGITETWTAPGADVSPEMFVELLGSDVANEIFAGVIPQPAGFPCSEYGKKVLRAGKWIWKGLILAGEAVCCGATTGAGCILCAIGGEIVGEIGEGALDDYCE